MDKRVRWAASHAIKDALGLCRGETPFALVVVTEQEEVLWDADMSWAYREREPLEAMLRTISVVGDPACVRQWLLDEEDRSLAAAVAEALASSGLSLAACAAVWLATPVEPHSAVYVRIASPHVVRAIEQHLEFTLHAWRQRWQYLAAVPLHNRRDASLRC